jgi:hypothetical protein
MVVESLYRTLHAHAWKLAESGRDRDQSFRPTVPGLEIFPNCAVKPMPGIGAQTVIGSLFSGSLQENTPAGSLITQSHGRSTRSGLSPRASHSNRVVNVESASKGRFYYTNSLRKSMICESPMFRLSSAIRPQTYSTASPSAWNCPITTST